jgi:hypothetical protein
VIRWEGGFVGHIMDLNLSAAKVMRIVDGEMNSNVPALMMSRRTSSGAGIVTE